MPPPDRQESRDPTQGAADPTPTDGADRKTNKRRKKTAAKAGAKKRKPANRTDAAEEQASAVELEIVTDTVGPEADAGPVKPSRKRKKPASRGKKKPADPEAEAQPEAADPDAAAAGDQTEDHTEDHTEAQGPDRSELPNVLCALLLSSKEAQTPLRLAQATHTTPKAILAALETLDETLTASGLPLEVSITGEQVRLLTSPEVFGYVNNLKKVKKQEKLSAAALETLAVIAYRQPVMRAEIEAIRGVKAGPILRTLLDHRMIKITGRADVPGRPLQYGTTQHFLETFGLKSVKELPSVKEFKAL